MRISATLIYPAQKLPCLAVWIELVKAIPSVVTAVTAVVGVSIAARGLNKWRAETIGKRWPISIGRAKSSLRRGRRGASVMKVGDSRRYRQFERILRHDRETDQQGRFFRPGRTGGELSYDRAEAARILLTMSSHSGMDPTDRAYLAKLIASDTGTPAPDAERRVDEVTARVKQDISRARSSAVFLRSHGRRGCLAGRYCRLGGCHHCWSLSRWTRAHSLSLRLE